jgi:hypothetical protein
MEKVTISTQINRDAFGMFAQLAGFETDDELWQKLTKEPINVDLQQLDDKEAQIGLGLALAGLALMKIAQNG